MERKGRFHPRLAEFDARLRHIETHWMDFEFEAEKGLRGATYFTRCDGLHPVPVRGQQVQSGQARAQTRWRTH